MKANQERRLLTDQSSESTTIDHTLLDIEVCKALNGEVLGRPYLTVMFDTHTRKIVATHLSFNNPDYRSFLSVLRDYFYRYGKLPKSISIDSKKEFQTLRIDQVICHFGIVMNFFSDSSKGKVETIFQQFSQFISKF
ncbi:integrase catalytic domain-containing protein [Leptolyngbya sp. AN02str]|uniref:integrase catalytic domain-containing protein n=1 Tax=Leptolyngbya sp. AN02str TaxID=3423363 RepID=UPI0029A55D24|nr:transposase family protein [Leptolyngbyaceae cyanobacterium bins.302]